VTKLNPIPKPGYLDVLKPAKRQCSRETKRFVIKRDVFLRFAAAAAEVLLLNGV